MKIVNSAICTFCVVDEEALERMFWDQNLKVLAWLDRLASYKFPHCSYLRLSKELVIFGCDSNLHTDKFLMFSFFLQNK